jgi:hypothetical protein
LKYKKCCWEKDRLEEQKETEFVKAIEIYAEPIFDQTEGMENSHGRAMMLGRLFWSIAQMDDSKRKKEVEDIGLKIFSDRKGRREFRSLGRFMMKRYDRMFGKDYCCPRCDGYPQDPDLEEKSARPPLWFRVLLTPVAIAALIFFSSRRLLQKILRRWRRFPENHLEKSHQKPSYSGNSR